MHFTDDVARGAWLLDRVGDWGRVGGVAGTGFEAYARVLHPIRAHREDLTVTDEHGLHPVVEETRWHWADVAERNGRMMHPHVQWRRLTDDETLLSFDDGWELSQSEEGALAPDLLAALAEHLGRATTAPDDVTCGVWNGWGELNGSGSTAFILFGFADAAAEERERERLRAELDDAVAPEIRRAVTGGPFLEWPGRELVLLTTSLEELSDPSWVERAGLGAHGGSPGVMPQLLWPADRAWVVASEIDWDSTVVAGPRELVDAVLADDRLEAYEVGERSDLTWDGDLLNGR